MNRVQKIWSSRTQVDINDFVGEPGELFYDTNGGTIRVSDGNTTGGVPVNSGASFDSVEPTNPANGQLWYNPDTNQLQVYDTGAWVSVNGAGSVSSINDLTDVSLLNTQAGDALVYNSVTSLFENKSINLTGGLINQVLVKQSGSDYDYRWEDMIIQLPEQTYTKLLDTVSDTLWYYGEAVPDSATSSAVWRIQQITFDSAGNVVSVYFAAGGNFDQVWDSRASLVYS